MPKLHNGTTSHSACRYPALGGNAPAPGSGGLLNNQGFTLLELMLATAIATLVVAILAIALTFSLRMWEHQRGDTQPSISRIIALMEYQLACYDPQTVTFDGKSKFIFEGDSNSLTLATDYSVKALSRGVPVIARYIYDPKEKELYYAEIPMDPYHPKAIQDFLQMSPGRKDSWPHFYSVKMPDFALSYQAPETEKFVADWDSDKEIPQAMLLKWRSQVNQVMTDEMVPGFLFPLSTETSTKPQNQGGS